MYDEISINVYMQNTACDKTAIKPKLMMNDR